MPRRKVLVVGGGFAGAYLARFLSRAAPDLVGVQLLDTKNYFVFQPLLPEVAGGAVNPLDIVTPLRQMLPGVDVRSCTVRGVDLAGRAVEVVEGPMGKIERLSYDHLVLAFGLAADFGRFPGLAEHAFTVKEAADAFALRNHVIGCLERAAVSGDAAARRRLLTFVVVGGGFSGVEVIGEVHELVHRSLRFYPSIGRNELRFALVEFLPAILPELPDDLARYAADTLRRRGIELILGHGVRSAAATSLELDDGSLIGTETVVATIGNGPTPLAGSLGLAMAKGRIVTAPDLSVPGLEGVWAAGDCAAVPLSVEGGQVAPPTAQAALRQAETLAANIVRAVRGQPTRAFSYRSRGAMASLGGRKAVVQVFGIKLSGTLAWVLWRIAYIGMLPVWSTRARVAAEQVLDLVLPRSTVRSQTAGEPPSRFVRHRTGDVVMLPGQLGDGVHIVIEGAYEGRTADGRTERFLPGDSFGVAEILSGSPHEGCIRALEPSRCFIMRRGEFERVAEALRLAGRREIKGWGRSLAR